MHIESRGDRRKKRGIALLITLMVVSLVAMLLGAFFTANRTQLDIFKSSQGEEQLQRSAYSIMSYIQSRMEQDSSWPKVSGSSAVPNNIDTVVQLNNIETVSSSANTHEIWGYYFPDRVGFHARIYNNLTGKTRFIPKNATKEYEYVPPQSARVLLETFHSEDPKGEDFPRHSRVKSQVVTVRQAAQIDSTLVSSRGIFLDAEKLVFTSTDEVRNQIRSLHDIEFADIDSLGFGQTMGSAPGAVWARGKITSNGRSIHEIFSSLDPGQAQSEDPENPEAVTQNLSRGRFLENALSEYGTPSFDIGDIKKLKASTGLERADVTLHEGVWEFTRVPVTYLPSWKGEHPVDSHLDILVHRSSSAADSEVKGVYAEVAWNSKDFVINSSNLNISSENVTKLSDWSGKYRMPVKGSGGKADFNNKNSPIIDFRQRQIILAADVNYTVDGNFGVTTNIVDSDVETPDWSKPQMILANGWAQTDEGNWTSQRAYLEVKGDLTINGKLDGIGNVVSNGNIAFELVDSNLAADTKTDFALYAGKDITIKGSSKHPNLSMKGLVYAKGNVLLDFTEDAITPIKPYTTENATLRDYPTSDSKAGYFKIEGAVVSEKGGMVVRGLKYAEFLYNPDYLDNLFNVDEKSMRLEAISWWPVN